MQECSPLQWQTATGEKRASIRGGSRILSTKGTHISHEGEGKVLSCSVLSTSRRQFPLELAG